MRDYNNRYNENDCVIRAIVLATNKTYDEVKQDLYSIACKYNCEFNVLNCYTILLEFCYFFEKIDKYKGEQIKSFLAKENKGKFLIRCDGHLTFCDNGVVYDIFNPLDMIIDIVYKVC